MSAWRMGADATRRLGPRTVVLKVPSAQIAAAAAAGGGGDVTVEGEVVATEQATTADLVQKAADVYTKWIPGDVLAVYLALTAAFRGTLEADGAGITPHAWGILAAGLGLAAGLTLLGAISANLSEPAAAKRAKGVEVVGRMLLAVLAFGFWSLTVPGAWWEVKGWNPGVLASIAFAVSIAFALVAEIAVAVLKPGAP